MPWTTTDDDPDLIEKEIKNLGVECAKIELDLMQETSISTLFEAVEKRFGSASILVNNAAYSTQTNITGVTSEALDKHYFINLKAPTLLIFEFVKCFKSTNNGRIINLSSGQSLSAMNDEIAYAMTKSAIETLTRTVSHELAKKGITINAVNPGLTDSGWMNDDLKTLFQDRVPMGSIC